MKISTPTALIGGAAFLLAACQPVQPLSEYAPAVDPGKYSQAKYQRDLQDCRMVAERVEADYKARQQKEVGQRLVTGVLVGAVLGAAVGTRSAHQGDLIATGAATGAVAGAASGDYNHDLVTYGPRRVVDRCLQGRGYRLLTDFGQG